MRDDSGTPPPPSTMASEPAAGPPSPRPEAAPAEPPTSPAPLRVPQPEDPSAAPPTFGPANLTVLGEQDRAALWNGDADEAIEVDTHYIQSNETRHDLFFPFIEGVGGAYVGVGSDQNYTVMAKARAEYAFLLDIDTRVIDLHRLYEALLIRSETPQELVDHWSGDHADATEALLREHFADDPQLVRLVGGFRSGRETVHRHLLRVLDRKVDGVPTSWLSASDLFEHTRAMFRTGRVRMMVGNLAGSKAMKTVAAAASALGTNVRVYYPSNAEDYFRYDRNYRENVRAFPIDDRSVVVRTIYRKEWEHADLWAYQVQPLSDLQARLAVLHNRSRKSMLKYAEAEGVVRRDTGVKGLSLVAMPAQAPAK